MVVDDVVVDVAASLASQKQRFMNNERIRPVEGSMRFFFANNEVDRSD